MAFFDRELKSRRITPEQARILGLAPTNTGVRIPYWEPWSGDWMEGFYRLRFWKARGKDGQKYTQPSGLAPRAYFCRLRADWKEVLDDASRDLIITEGEYKAIAATIWMPHCPVVAIGGVWNFGSKARRQRLIPDLRKSRIRWQGRRVQIVYDSDSARKQDVQQAEARLAELLTEYGAYVEIVRLPQTGKKKIGLDDYIFGEIDRASKSAARK